MVNPRRGIALVDIIIASVLLGVALATILGMTGRAISAQAEGEKFQAAAMLADEQLALVLARGPDNYGASFPTTGVCEEPFTDYRFNVEISGGEAGEAYAVAATILWTARGREQSIVVETLIAPRVGDEPDPDRRPQEPLIRY